MTHFYLADEKHKTVKGDVVDIKGLLYFQHDKAGFDGKATADHVKQYPSEFGQFKQANPDYVLPDWFADGVIGSPTVQPHAPDEVVTPHPDEMFTTPRRGVVPVVE